jgi:transcriptional regulator with GAF, ATPase, and Fis domain
VALNCAGLPESLLESELFGHVRGSFTGAVKDRPGKLQLAHRGILFLDEVGDMSLRMQGLLLRFLESGELQTVGADYLNPVTDVRVVAATNCDLAARVRERLFREDLFYRLRVIHVRVPPLRDRTEDIPALAAWFLERLQPGTRISDEAIGLLRRYHWPGNVRELQNVIEQATWLSDSNLVEVEHVAACLDTATTAVPTRERRRQTADDLFDGLVNGNYSFWEHVHPKFLARDLTRHDIRELLHRGLATTAGNYKSLLRLFGIAEHDYKRLLNFLSAHDCNIDARPFREGLRPIERARPLAFNEAGFEAVAARHLDERAAAEPLGS